MLHAKDFKTIDEFNIYIEHVAELSKFFSLDYKYVREMELEEIDALLVVQTNYVKSMEAQRPIQEHQILTEDAHKDTPVEAIAKEDYLE